MIGQEYRTDKIMNGYLPAYQEMQSYFWDRFDPYDTGAGVGRLRILEIGAGDGAGMEMYRSLFETDHVFGVDNEPARGQIPNVLVADQMDPLLPTLRPGPWDLIVDDASHLPPETSRTLIHMWPTVAPGGLYVIEDWNFYAGEGNASALWQPLLGAMIRYQYVGNTHHGQPYSEELSMVEEVTVRHGLIIARKTDASTQDNPQ